MGLNQFWNGRKVFVTGITGFKGSWLSSWLNLLGAEVKGYSLKPEHDEALYNLLDVSGFCSTVFGDIRDEENIFSVLDEFQPEIVFHLAAQPLVQESYANPRETYEINLMGTINLIESALKIGSVKSFINVTSDKVYENKSWHWGYRENERLNGSDPYSNSKSCADLIANCYRNSFIEEKFNLSNVRSGNVIGGGDWAENRLIPDMMRAIISKKEMKIRNPSSTRPWQHVLEPLYGYMLLAEQMYRSRIYVGDWNFGPDLSEDAPVKKIADLYSEYWSKDVSFSSEKDSFREAKYLRLDSSKANAELGWKPLWDLHEAVKKTFCWYEEFLKGSDVKLITLDQINNYQNLIENYER